MALRVSPVILLPLGVLLAGCAASPTVPLGSVDGPGTGWSVTVEDPRSESTADCSEDPSVSMAIQSADLPSSQLALQLVSGATEADAFRLADCLAAALRSGKITISAPAQ